MTQVQTEIDRLESAKEAIATAIAGKGVTVPDGTMLDGMAALIESIEAGTGGEGGAKSVLSLLGSGTITGNSGATINIPHGLGVTPIAITIDTYSSVGAYGVRQLISFRTSDTRATGGLGAYGSTTSNTLLMSGSFAINWSETMAEVTVNSTFKWGNSGSYTWKAYG